MAALLNFAYGSNMLLARLRERVPGAKPVGVGAYFSPSWTAFQADRGRDFSVIVDGVSV
jgi:hypothetical protein